MPVHKITNSYVPPVRKEPEYHLLVDPNSGSHCNTTVLNPGTDDELHCTGYRWNAGKLFLYYTACFITLGILVLVMHWKPDWKLVLTQSPCKLEKANTVLLKDCYDRLHVSHVRKVPPEEGLPNEYLKPDCRENGYGSGAECDDSFLNKQDARVFRYFVHVNYRYYWNYSKQIFIPLWGLDDETRCIDLAENFRGYSAEEQNARLKIFGENSIEIEVPSRLRLLIDEVLNPFYIFQLLSTIYWFVDEYTSYASCIVVISAISLAISLYETRKQRVTLRDMVSSSNSTEVTVIRDTGESETISASLLVPGDVIVIPPIGCIMSCDAVLTAGNAIVSEGILTGESVPVTKIPISHHDNEEEVYHIDFHRRFTLFAGTHVIQTRYYEKTDVTAVVVRTGFSTLKGELVNAILFPKPMDFKFYQDAFKFVLVMASIAVCGMVYGIYAQIIDGQETEEVILRGIDIITIVVPPSLPAAMTVGTIYAQNRLKHAGLFCISPPRINVSGKLKLFCFDKTGTLTEEGLDLWGVVPVEGDRFQSVVTAPDVLPRGPLLASMASCHSLTKIDGELTGDPMDLKMFAATKWVLLEAGRDTSKFNLISPTIVKPVTKETYLEAMSPDEVPYEIGIVRQFHFSSSLQMMSVITRTLGSRHMDLYAKGAPEKLMSLCLDSSVPDDFHEVLERFTIQGFRVIALAHKKLKKLQWHQAQRAKRGELERELSFLGLLVMQNTLKPETTPVISELRKAVIRTVMLTGDNMHTAISVARDCGMVEPEHYVIMAVASPPEENKPASIHWEYAITPTAELSDSESSDTFVAEKEKLHNSYQEIVLEQVIAPCYHIAINGRSWTIIREHFPELIPKVVMKGTVFARMSPEQKVQVVEELQDLGYIVGMCGDGANDCGALKTAHAGISLSEAEASVASPFTSKVPNITCVPILMREGRCALVTSFGVFKYMALYSMIQFISVLILYAYNTNFGDMEFLYIDLVITTTVAVFMGYTKSYHKLVAKRPYGSLVGIPTLFSVISQIVVQAGAQIGVLLYLISRPGITRDPVPKGEFDPVTWESTAIFTVSSFQYIFLAALFSKGPPFRKPFYTNYLLLACLLLLGSFSLVVLIWPVEKISDFMELYRIPDEFMSFRWMMLCFVVGNFLISFIIEVFIIDSKLLKKIFRLCCKKRRPKNRYKVIEQELNALPDWPPVNEVTYAQSNDQDHTADDSIS
ncbi:PREDICTED: probable cation-transporting ATPase 13A3 isoform X2 [Priapulus caudatus]|uniref:Cation-transporting ATPase n=1 Tax=Priapulus caudatus TaxID=37621 RepID=A0ABM1E1C8_PRICU|nr:PREDICTED: probable cation-transporting ATPase 13A3 isoform X2 [Priapulus caudatus]